jgi:hypothetical protein
VTDYAMTAANINFGEVPAGTTASQIWEAPALHAVTLDEFVAVDEPGAEALVGEAGEAVIAEDSDVTVYGDGGAGKTTLCVDLACHLAAGDDWLGMPVARPARVLLVENEGPRPLFRRKLRGKRDGWAGSPLEGRVLVVEAPWARLSFADEKCRAQLAELIQKLELDVVIAGPITRLGMNEAGTLQEVRDFMALVADARARTGRRVTFVLVHHENKGGQVSGAWEGAGDTLLHVQGQGHGRTRLYVQKARWSSAHHATALNLVWTDGDGFAVEDKPELEDDALAELILDAVRTEPGTGWTKVEKAISGIRNDRLRAIRDGLLASGRIVNRTARDGVEWLAAECEPRKPASLYLADDPTIQHLSQSRLRPGRGAAGAQPAPPGGEGGQLHLRPAPRPIRGAGAGAQTLTPSESDFRGAA